MSKLVYLFLWIFPGLFLFISDISNAQGFNSFTAEKKAEYYISLKQNLPEVFQRNGGWFTNPAVVADKESQFLEWFKTPEVQALMMTEKPSGAEHFQISAKIETKELQETPVLTSEAFISLRGHLAQLTESVDVDGAKIEALNIFRHLDGMSSNGVLTGMVQSLPGELKGLAFKLPLNEKLDFLKTNLTEEMLKTNFRSKAYRQDQISKDFLFQEYRRLLSAEQRLSYLTILIRWQRAHHDLNGVIEEGLETPQDLFESIEITGTLLASEKKKFIDTTSNVVSSLIKPYLTLSKIPTWVTSNHLILEIMPPQYAVYRGSLNGDCFTSFAFGYAYAPSERTILVRDDKGKFLMTVYAIVAELGGKKVLYVHDTGNPNLSAALGPLVMRALDAAKADLGIESLAIGPKGMHHSAFGQAIANSAKPSTLNTLKFYDFNSREAIGNKLVDITKSQYSKGHDMPASHPTARFYVPIEEAIRVTTATNTRFDKLKNPPSLSKSEILELAFDLASRSEVDILKSIFGDTEATEIYQTIQNAKALSALDFKQSVLNLTIKLNLPYTEAEQKRTEHTLEYGFLRASDAWSERNVTISSHYLANMLKANMADLNAFRIMKLHPEFFQTPAFEKLLKYFLKDNPASLTNAETLLNAFPRGPLKESIAAALLDTVEFEHFQKFKHHLIETFRSAELQISQATEDKFIKLANLFTSDFLDLVKRNPHIVNKKILQTVMLYDRDPNHAQIVRDIYASAKLKFPKLFEITLGCPKAQAS